MVCSALWEYKEVPAEREHWTLAPMNSDSNLDLSLILLAWAGQLPRPQFLLCKELSIMWPAIPLSLVLALKVLCLVPGKPGWFIPLLHRLSKILSGSDTSGSKPKALLKSYCLCPFESVDWVTVRQGGDCLCKERGRLPASWPVTQRGCCQASSLTSKEERSAENGTLRQETFLGFPVGKKFENNWLMWGTCSKCWGCQHSCKWANDLFSYIYN